MSIPNQKFDTATRRLLITLFDFHRQNQFRETFWSVTSLAEAMSGPQDPDPVPVLPFPPPQQSQPPAKAKPAQSSKSVPEHVMHKNRLQEYTQKSSLHLPVYQTVNEGAQHAPKFRTTVLVDGTCYTSRETFPTRKGAEQDAARIALENIQQKMKEDGCPIIRKDTTFCKTILNEYAVKMHLEIPSYHTIQQVGMLPVFISSLVFNGVSYTGDRGRNKKEAEQLAARVVILSILDSADSGSVNVMSETIKSKYKLYAALDKIKDTNSIHSAAIPFVNTWEEPGQFNKRKEAEVASNTVNIPINATCESSFAEAANIQAAYLPLHQFKKPKPVISTEVIAPPIVFVPPGLGQPLLPSTSGVKQNRRNKKKAKRGVQIGPQMLASVVSMNQIPPCSVAQ